MTTRSSEYAAQHPDLGFAIFMDKADRAVSRRTGLSVFDFCDANWADLYESGEHSEEAIFDTLADADELFAAWLESEDA